MCEGDWRAAQDKFTTHDCVCWPSAQHVSTRVGRAAVLDCACATNQGLPVMDAEALCPPACLPLLPACLPTFGALPGLVSVVGDVLRLPTSTVASAPLICSSAGRGGGGTHTHKRTQTADQAGGGAAVKLDGSAVQLDDMPAIPPVAEANCRCNKCCCWHWQQPARACCLTCNTAPPTACPTPPPPRDAHLCSAV